jgi:hypothetical protein
MYKQIVELQKNLSHLQKEYWIHSDFLSFPWWMITIVNIAFIIIFLLLIDRQRILHVIIAFLVAFIVIGMSDEIGTKFNLWQYPHQFLYFTTRFNAVDFGAVPCLIALLYQYCSKWKYFIIGNILISLFISFVGTPLFVKIGIYKLVNWNYFYSFLVTLFCTIVVKVIVDFIIKRQIRYHLNH